MRWDKTQIWEYNISVQSFFEQLDYNSVIFIIIFCFRFYSNKGACVLKPGEICDLLKGCILVTCSVGTLYIDTSVMYHIIKSQSVIKLYIFFNMLEVGDRLFSSFGQDTIDALYWTAIEPRDRKREHVGVLPHLLLVMVYVCILFMLFII